MPERRLVPLALVVTMAILAGCASPAASVAPASTTPVLTEATVRPSASATPPPEASGDLEATRTFPPSQTAIAPGRYRWEGFGPTISVDLGPGWALGHDNPTFFDLFRGSDFPSVTFARFTDVYVDKATRAEAVHAAFVATTLAGRADMTVANLSTVEVGGLTGRQFDLTTAEAQTPLFSGRAGDFKLDPEFKSRYRVLDFPGGGVLVVGIHTRDGGFDDGVALGDPVAASLTVEP